MKFGLDADVLVVVAVLFAVLMYYQLIFPSPIVFGDEGWYAGIGRYMATSGLYPSTDPLSGTAIFHIPFGKQPLWFLENTWAWLAGGETGVKLLLPLMPGLAAMMLYLWLRKAVGKGAGLAGAFILLAIPSVISYGGTLDYVEGSLMLWFTCASYFGYNAFEHGRKAHAVAAGIFSGFAIATDITGLMLVPLLVGVWALTARKMWRQMLLISVVALAVFVPVMVRETALCGSPTIPFIMNAPCTQTSDVTIPLLSGLQRELPYTASVSTGASVINMGLLSYGFFAFGWAALALAVFGLSLARPNRLWTMLLITVVLVGGITLFVNSRAEDIPRSTLFGFPAIAAMGGIFVAEAYGFLKRRSAMMAYALAIVMVFFIWAYAQQKLDSMYNVKHGLDGIVDGCNWVRANTPADSIIYAIYSHQVAYQCDRMAIAAGLPDQAEIRSTFNDTSYEHLKLHGFDYVLIEQFTISDQGLSENTPTKFVSYLQSSPHFEKVYDNIATFSSAGVSVYRIR